MKNKGTDDVYNTLNEMEDVIITIEDNSKASFNNRGSYNGVNSGLILWDPTLGVQTTDFDYISPATTLDHESKHKLNKIENKEEYNKRRNTSDKEYGNKEEKEIIENRETETAKKHGEKPRKNHSREYIKTNSPIRNTHPNELGVDGNKEEEEEQN